MSGSGAVAGSGVVIGVSCGADLVATPSFAHAVHVGDFSAAGGQAVGEGFEVPLPGCLSKCFGGVVIPIGKRDEWWRGWSGGHRHGYAVRAAAGFLVVPRCDVVGCRGGRHGGKIACRRWLV